ncbi:MAG: hypothetical protein ACOYOF_21835 [Verrucomicrobiaceae bacterium]
MQTSHFVLVLLASANLYVLAQAPNKPLKEVAALLSEFERDVTRVKEPRLRVLRAEGSKIVANLLRESSNEEVQKVGLQIENKAAGKSVDDAPPVIKPLFDAFDRAVTIDLKPIQDKYLKRIDALIKTYKGKDLQMVLALADTRKSIERGEVAQPTVQETATIPVGGVASNVSRLTGTRHDPTGQSWGIGTSGTLYSFLKGGRGERTDRGVNQPFTWKANSKGQIELEGPSFRPRIIIFDATATQAELFINETGEKSGVLQRRK